MNRALFVDSDPHFLRSIQQVLQGYLEVVVAENGLEALDLLDRGPFPIVFSDLHMPGSDGAALLDCLAERWPNSFRVGLVSSVEQIDAVEALNAGLVSRIITMPCSDEAFKQHVVAVLDICDARKHEQQAVLKSINNCMRMLTDVLAFMHADAFGKASQIRLVAARLADSMSLLEAQEIELAAILQEIGWILDVPDLEDSSSAHKVRPRRGSVEPFVNPAQARFSGISAMNSVLVCKCI